MQETPVQFLSQEVGKSSLERGWTTYSSILGLPWWLRQRIRLRCGRPELDPWAGKIPWKRTWQPTPIFLPGKIPMDRGVWQATVHGVAEFDKTEWLSTQHNLKPRECADTQRCYSADEGPCSQGCGLLGGHVHLWELDHKEGRVPKNWCLWTVVLEKTPESPLDSKEIKPVNLKGDQPWIFTGRTDTEAPVFWLSDAKRWFIGKVPDAGKDWGQKEKRASEDEMAGWYHWCNEHELGQTPGEGEEQRGLAYCSPWDHRETDVTGRPNTNLLE